MRRRDVMGRSFEIRRDGTPTAYLERRVEGAVDLYEQVAHACPKRVAGPLFGDHQAQFRSFLLFAWRHVDRSSGPKNPIPKPYVALGPKNPIPEPYVAIGLKNPFPEPYVDWAIGPKNPIPETYVDWSQKPYLRTLYSQSKQEWHPNLCSVCSTGRQQCADNRWSCACRASCV